MSIEVYPLFSNPIMHLKSELPVLDFSTVKWGQNYTNKISISQDILNLPEFAELKKICTNGLKEYFYGLMNVVDDTEIYITESWLNMTVQGEVHHRHWHPNSIVSGVLFLQTDLDAGGEIMFITNKYETLEFDVNGANLYNSKSWSLPPLPGSMVLFPSSQEHLVEQYKGNTPRISLSFNSFVKGSINKQGLTKLEI
jgi:uncharacterized protein (TIGR02466 family)